MVQSGSVVSLNNPVYVYKKLKSQYFLKNTLLWIFLSRNFSLAANGLWTFLITRTKLLLKKQRVYNKFLSSW